MHWRVVALSVTLGVLASACSTGGSLGGPTSQPSATESSCATLVDSASGTKLTRYEVPNGSNWWVSYAVLTNPCPANVTLRSIEQADPQQASDMGWTGKSGVMPATETPDAFWPASQTRAMSAVPNYIVAPGAKVQIVAEVTQVPGEDPHGIPGLKLRLSGKDGPSTYLALHPDFSFCSCKPPA